MTRPPRRAAANGRRPPLCCWSRPTARGSRDRPAALVVAKDGALLVADETDGTIWRIAYKSETVGPSRQRPSSATPPPCTHGPSLVKPPPLCHDPRKV